MVAVCIFIYLWLLCRHLRAMLVNVIELRASNWGRNENDRTAGAGDSTNGRSSLNNWRVRVTVMSSFEVLAVGNS